MAMSVNELERALRALRLSGMSATLQARALAVASHEMDFVEAFSWLVQDELDLAPLAAARSALCAVRARRAQRLDELRLELQPAAAQA